MANAWEIFKRNRDELNQRTSKNEGFVENNAWEQFKREKERKNEKIEYKDPSRVSVRGVTANKAVASKEDPWSPDEEYRWNQEEEYRAYIDALRMHGQSRDEYDSQNRGKSREDSTSQFDNMIQRGSELSWGMTPSLLMQMQEEANQKYGEYLYQQDLMNRRGFYQNEQLQQKYGNYDTYSQNAPEDVQKKTAKAAFESHDTLNEAYASYEDYLRNNPKTTSFDIDQSTWWGKTLAFLEDAGAGIFEGGFEQWATGFNKVLDYAERGANGAAAWALRDLAKAVPAGKVKDKMLGLAEDFESYYTGDSKTGYAEGAEIRQKQLQSTMQEITRGRDGADKWVIEQMPSAGNMLFNVGASTALTSAVGQVPKAGMSRQTGMPQTAAQKTATMAERAAVAANNAAVKVAQAGTSSLAMLGATAGGSAALEAQQNGASDTQALLYGIAAGGMEVFSEKLFGGNPLYDVDAGLVNQLASKLGASKTIMKILDSKVFGIASEGLEEVVTEVIDPVFEAVIYNGKNTEFATVDDIASAFAGGVFLSLVGNVTNLPNDVKEARYKKAAKNLAAQAESIDDAQVQRAAQAVKEQVDMGRTPDAESVGDLLRAMESAGATVDTDAAAETAQEEQTFEKEQERKDTAEARAGAQEADAGITGNELWAKEMPQELLQEARDRGYGTTEAVVLDSAYKDHAKHEKNPLSPKEYAKRFDAAYIYGKSGTSLTATYGKKEVRGLTRPTIKAAHELGVKAYQEAPYRNTSVSDQTQDAYIAGLNEKLASGEISEREYDRAFDDYYQGGESEAAELRRTQTVRNETTQQGTNGQQTATQGAREQEVKKNGTGESVLHESGKRTGRADTGVAAGIVEEGAGRTESRKESARAIREKVDLENQIRDRKIGKVSTRAAGVPGGTQNEIVTVVPNDIRTETMQEAERFLKAEGFEKVKFVLGAMEIRDGRSGQVVKAEGFIDGTNVWIRADSKLYTMHQLAAHESFHLASQMDPNLRSRLAKRLMEEYGVEFDAMIAKYMEAYQGCYGLEDPDAWDYIEEILADAYAGMNRKNLGADKYEKIVKEEVNQNKSQRETGAERKTGPPEGKDFELPVKGKFSMEEPVEQTGTMLAIHNKDWNFIRDAVLNWGGIPAPSIAIVEAQQGHTAYGDTSVIYPRSTIDPQTDSRNKVYGSDAWTPTQRDAQVEYEVNYDAKRAFEDMIEELSGQFAGGAFRNASVISSTGANSETSMTLDEIARKLAKYPAVQAAYLQSRGETLEPVYKKKKFDSFGNEALQAFIDRVGYQELARLDMEMTLGNNVGAESLEAARDIIIEDWVYRNEWRLRQKPEIREKRIENQRKKLEDWRVEGFIRHAWEYYEEYGANSDEIDTNATGAAMLEMILPDGSLDDVERVVQEWVRPQLEGILGEPGIFNGKDRITDEGRLEFWETHYPFNAENVVRAMYEQGEERGGGIWNISSTGIVATATPEYGSVEEIHAAEDRLRTIDEGEYKKLMRDLDIELERVTDDIMGTTQRKNDNEYEEEQNIGRVIIQVALGERTIPAAKKTFRKEGYKISDSQARIVLRLLEHAGSVPAGYFEAKPKRVVGFEEALAIIAPDSAPAEEVEAVRNAGVNVIEYEAGNNKQRMEIANSLKGAKFSISEETKTAWNTDKEQLEIDAFLKGNPDWAKTIGGIQEAADKKAEENGLTNEQLEDLPKKAKDVLRRARNSFTYKVSSALQVPVSANRNFLRSAVNAMMDEYMKTGKISQETKNVLFEEAYEKGVAIDDEFYNQYKDVKKKLKDTAVTISETDKADIADFALFKKQTSRTLNIKESGGLPVDVFYQELREMAPELFKGSITHPADQLQKMHEVARSIEISKRSLDEYYGAEKETFKSWARGDFEQAAEEMESQLAKVRRFAEDQTVKEEPEPEIATVEQANEAYQELKRARREYEKANAKNLLTKADKLIVDKLVRGDLRIEDIAGEQMSREITEVYEAARDYRAAQKRIEQWRNAKRAEKIAQAKRDVGNAYLWKDKKGISYMRETQERNIRDIAPDAETAERVIRNYIRPVHQNNAEATRMKNEYRERVKKLNVSRVIEKGNIISEASAVQMIGEAEDNIRVLEKDNRFDAKRDGKTLQEWREVVQKVWKENPNLNKAKVNKAIQDFRTIYDELFQKMNEVRVRNGYEPVNYRQGYFPHFQPGQTDGIISLFAKAMGIDAEVTALPTSINGLTHTFRPGIQWFGPALERIGYNTAYDAVEGFDRYIEGVADVVWHTDDIQRLRALERAIRYLSTDEGIREQIDAVEKDARLTMEEKEAQIKQIYEHAKFSLGNFAVNLNEYTNSLANKKHSMDRNVEQLIGRNFYNLAKALEGRVAANMVAINPASWLTNFIPLTQAGMEIDTKSMLEGMWQTLKAYKTDDGFAGSSTFLTNRRGSDPLVKTWGQRTSETLSKPMAYIDTFTADSIVRARYLQNVKRGMSEEMARSEADEFAAGVMADRSKGSMPTIFGARNPVIKLFSQFQLEVNNQLSWLFKDVPREMKDRGLKVIAAAIIKYVLGAFLYNEVYEYFIGRRPALDPIGILNDTVGDFTGYELPNLVEGVLEGDWDFRTEKKGAGEALKNAAKNLSEELPFIGGLLGGGRLPISSTLPSATKVWDALTDPEMNGRKRANVLLSEAAKPLAHWILPFGGGQIKKLAYGIGAVARGGSYTVDKEGNDILQYPVFNETVGQKVGGAAKAVFFGKSAMKGAQEWVESGFKSLSAKQTSAYKAMIAAGEGQMESWDVIDTIRKTKKTEDKSQEANQKQALAEADISDAAKVACYYALFADEEEQAKIETFVQEGLNMDAYLQYQSATAGIKADKDSKGESIDGTKKRKVLEAINALDVSDEQKDFLVEAAGYKPTVLTPWKYMDYAKFEQAVRTGKGMRDMVKEALNAGAEPGDITEIVTMLFKDEYINAPAAERADLKARIITVAEVMGGTSARNSRAKAVDKWLEGD